MDTRIRALLLPNFPPFCVCVSQVTIHPYSFFPGVLTSSDFELFSLVLSPSHWHRSTLSQRSCWGFPKASLRAVSFFSLRRVLPTLSASEELLGLFEGVPSLCELFFLTQRSATLPLSLRTRHPSRSVSLSQTCRYNPLLLRVCQLFTDSCQLVL